MVDPNTLWIGDMLKITSSGRIGTFEGIHPSGKLRIKSGQKIYLATSKNLEVYIEKEESDASKILSEIVQNEKETQFFTVFANTLDLHIEKLNPLLKNSIPERIIDYQIKALDHFINEVTERKIKTATIIHGKGTGVLRNIVESTLKSIPEVFNYHSINNDGAVSVFFKY